jgi:signal transduction histidine kinase/ligand-binding sensor domain-containing protein
MWFGTANGLNRFDGLNYKIYKSGLNDTSSIPDNNIFKIINDSKGRLLIATAKGICLYNRLDDNFFRINIKGSVKSKSDISVYTLLEDKHGNYWLGTQGSGIIKLSQDFHFIHQYRTIQNDNTALTSNYIWSLYEDKAGIIWIGDEEGNIYSLDPQIGKIYKNLSTNLSSIIDDFKEDRNDNLIVCTFSGVKFYKRKNVIGNSQRLIELNELKPSNPILNNEGRVYRCLYGFDNNLWFLHFNGFSVLNNLTHKILQSNSPYSPFGMPYSNVSQDLINDNQGNVWIGTFNSGIILFNKLYKNFHESDLIFKNLTITSIFEDSEGSLWIGTMNKGLYCVDTKTGVIRNYPIVDASKYGNKVPTVFVTYEAQDHEIFIGTYIGLFSFNKTTGKFKKYLSNPKNPVSINHYDIRDIIEDAKGNLWIASNGGGINILNRNTQTFTHILKNVNYPDSGIVDNYCLHFMKDRKGNLWIGTYNGFTKYDFTNHHFYNYNNDKKKILSQNWIYSFCEDLKGNIWLATGNGIDVYNPYSDSFKYYFIRDGLPDNVISGMECDSTGNIWISTLQGLCKYDNVRGKFIAFSGSDGLQVTDYAINSFNKNKKGELFFGGNGGYVSFKPDEIKQNKYSPKVIITNFKLFYKNVPVQNSKNSVLKHQISQTKEIYLHYNQNIITFEYIALNYLNPAKTQYAYQLAGFDKNWWNVGPRRDVTYTNLNPGTYTFRVKAANDDGVWNNNPTEIVIHIIPPFWETIWFLCLVITAIIFIIYIYNHFRIKRIMKQNKELEDIVIERTDKIRLQNQALERQANSLTETINLLNETNNLLNDRQLHIQEQSEEIIAQRDQLSQLNATKDKLFSILAHDLRNPFHIIMGFSELLVTNFQKLSEVKIKTFLDSIHKSAYSGNELLENILQWSRVQTGRLTFEPEEHNLSGICEEVIRLFEGKAQQKEITINQLIDPDIFVIVDENMLKTIFRNLISNAIKFTSNNGSITLNAQISDDPLYVEVAVSDTGVGIPESDVKNLFDIQNKVTTTGTAKETGTGLGLIICKEFVEIHKGKIPIISEPGKGSTFYFLLPNKP